MRGRSSSTKKSPTRAKPRQKTSRFTADSDVRFDPVARSRPLASDPRSTYRFYCQYGVVQQAPIAESRGRFFVRTRAPAGGIASKELKQKLKNVKPGKRPARRAIILKSASWYATPAL